MQLYIGNKNYSSWSLRPWLLMTQAAIPFEEIKLRLSFDADSDFKRTLATVAPSGKVPILVDEGFAVWDTLAIAEYLAEKYPAKALWPTQPLARARARSLCAEMHGGFGALRSHCPMNIEASLPEVGARVLAEQPGVAQDLARIVRMWQEQLDESGGPFLFGGFSIPDTYFAPVCTRIKTYSLPVPAPVAAYVERVFALPALQAWVAGALAENDFLDFDEPYRKAATH
ncbi:glutathione S-transferase family protein [Piscinibacter sp.]|uniref:glutathione S-transferase family protein n=1 Tax=Piscinibacter sp. TaxID=1903157 RepID=UPI002BA5F07A|nr:glutathione S-transferase family protein [Albitalea sp.]HUG25009.1 glutathione S-transferase family protein [Albitalea sp.]